MPLQFRVSTRAGKKYDVYNPALAVPRWIAFGAVGYAHYSDSKLPAAMRGIYETHHDKRRRTNYLTRARGIRDRRGRLTASDPNTANYYAIRYLW